MEYFYAALNLPIIMIFSSETEARLKKSKRIILLVNIAFYSFIIGWFSLFQDWLQPAINYYTQEKIYVFGLLILEIIPSIILLCAIARLRKLIKRFDTSQFIMKERLMNIHTGIYTAYVFLDFVSTGTQLLSKQEHSDKKYKLAC